MCLNKKSQVKIMTLTWLDDIWLVPKFIFFRKSQVMTLTFFKGPLVNTFRRFLYVPKGYLINILHFCHSCSLLGPFFESKKRKKKWKSKSQVQVMIRGGNIIIIKWHYFVMFCPRHNIDLMLCPGHKISLMLCPGHNIDLMLCPRQNIVLMLCAGHKIVFTRVFLNAMEKRRKTRLTNAAV